MEMKLYYFVLLRVGKKWTPEVTPETQRIREGHFANIKAMEGKGKLVLAGPFEEEAETVGPGVLDGLFILAADSKEEVQALLDEDPSIRTGRMDAEIHPWWGPAGINFPKDQA